MIKKGTKIRSKNTGKMGTIVKTGSSSITVTFEHGGEISVLNSKIKELFDVDDDFMADYYSEVNGYDNSKKPVVKMSFIEFCRKYPISLNDQQKEAVKAVDGANLILAVPGSGKTTVLTYRLGYLAIARNIKPENILAITYTNAAANEMRNRLHKFFGDDIKGNIEICTINSFSYSIVRKKISSKTADDEDISRIVRKILKKYKILFYDDIIRIYTGAISYVKSKTRNEWEDSITDVIRDRNLSQHFKEIFDDYNNALKEENLIDFNDQNNYAYEFLRDDPKLLSWYRHRYQYICVDEAQDTNMIQNKLIKLLAGSNPNLFMVGDDDQSIYSFNGSCPEELYSFQKTYPGAKVFKIETNYRSTEKIVAFSKKFIDRNVENRSPKNMIAARSGGADVKGFRVEDMPFQARYIASRLKDNNRKTAVLYRENSTGIVLAYHLDKNNIPFCFAKDDVSMFNTGSFRKVINYLKLINDPTDINAFEMIYYDLDDTLTAKVFHKIKGLMKEDDDKDVIDHLIVYAEKYAKSYFSLSKFKKMKELTWKALKMPIKEIIEDACDFMLDKNEFQIKKTSNILYSLADKKDTLKTFMNKLSNLEKLINEKNTNKEKEGIILSTIHGSKGLEYDVVYIADLYDGVLPGKAAEQDEKLMSEEKRILYVGITRAKDELYILNMKDNHSDFFNRLFSKNYG